jgi:tRNA1Val (adenine37-N6)-methyltransferase
MKIGTDAILLGALAQVESSKQILEVGTGSGIISLMLAQRSEAFITAIDIHAPSVRQAQENFQQSKWAYRIAVEEISFQNFHHDFLFDHIVSNPPFFSNALKSNSDSRNMARHNDTLLPEEMAQHVKRLLTSDGVFTCIIPYEGMVRYISAFSAMQMFPGEIIHIIPKPGRKINRVLIKFANKEKAIISKTFTLRDEDNKYSMEYRRITQHFHP